jgi:hypothetical protein
MVQYQLSAGAALRYIRQTTRLCKPGTAVSLVQTSIRGSHPTNKLDVLESNEFDLSTRKPCCVWDLIQKSSKLWVTS